VHQRGQSATSRDQCKEIPETGLPPCADKPCEYLGGPRHRASLYQDRCAGYSRGVILSWFSWTLSSQWGKVVLAPILASISPNVGGWTKGSLVIFLMTNTILGWNSNCLSTTEEDPSPTYDSCSFGALGDFMVEGFFRGTVPTIKRRPLKMYTKQCWVRTYKMQCKTVERTHTCNSC